MSRKRHGPVATRPEIVSKPSIQIDPDGSHPQVRLSHGQKLPLRTLPIRFENRDQLGTPAGAVIDAAALEKDLKAVVEGEVRFDDGTRAMYAHDASNYRMVPIGVVIPKDRD